MNIDINTLAILLSITHLLQVIVLFVQWQLDKNSPGLGWWLLGIGTIALGFVALFLRSLPQLASISIVGNNVLFVYGQTFLYIGILRFFDRRERRGPVIVLLIAYTLAAIYLTFINNDIIFRRTTLYLASAALAFLTARAVFRYRIRVATASANFLAVAFLAHGIVLSVSTLLLISLPPPTGITVASPEQVLPILDTLIATWLWTFGFILMVSQRLNEESREARESLDLIFNTIPDAVLVTRLNDGIVAVINDGFRMLTGYTNAEVIGKSSLEVNIWENPKDFQNFITALNEEGFCENVEAVFHRKDGSRLDGILSAKIISLKGAPHIISVTHDITERKRAEQEIAIIADIGRLIGSTLNIDEVYERFAAETRKLIPFDRITVNVHEPSHDIMRIAYVSGEDVPGRKRGDSFPLRGSVSEALIRTKTGLLGHPESVAEMDKQFPGSVDTIKAGMRSLMGIPLIYRDEVIASLHFRSKKMNHYRDRDLRLAERIGAQIAGAIGTAQMFSDLQKTENSLLESEGRFRGLIEQAAVGVAEIEMSTGRFFTVNRRFCEMVGRTEEEMLATTFQAITHPDDLHLHEKNTQMMLAGEIRHYSMEKRYIRKDGGIVWVNITVSPLWKPGEAPARNIAVVEEITDRKRMEEEILALSITDQLTGLYNRRGFLSLAAQQLKVAKRNKSGMLLFFVDLDGLKWINDTLGHENGDRALTEAATVLKETFRTSDIIARLGGDEYAALAGDIVEANSTIISERLQSLIDNRNNQENRRYRLSMSIGCSIYNPEKPSPIEELISSADKLMYEQKQKKKCQILQKASLSKGAHDLL